MFGNHKRLEKKLRSSGGTSATATVVECKTGMTITTGNDMIAANTKVVCKLKLQVTPSAEPAFEASTTTRFSQFSIPTQGDTVSVIYDPADHTKLVIDGSDAAQMHAILEKQIARHRARGTALDTAIADKLEEAHQEGRLDDPGTTRASIQAYNAEYTKVIQEAKQSAGMGSGPVISIGGQIVSDGHGTSGAQLMDLLNGHRAGGAPAATAAPDPVEQLTKLAALHDKGALTDAEFASEKAKIISPA
jgi:putative oligomerization/nucleic acid binding protein